MREKEFKGTGLREMLATALAGKTYGETFVILAELTAELLVMQGNSPTALAFRDFVLLLEAELKDREGRDVKRPTVQ